ncbi:MAG: FKBP-type peptidyl-prolyl cis-trans isomerase [Bdellovibrionales bacterium]
MNRLMKLIFGLSLTLVAAGCDQNKTPKTDTEKYSYALGYQFAKNLKQQSVEFDVAALRQGVKDVAGGKESQVSDQEAQAVMQKMYETRNAKMKAEGEVNLKKSQEWLATNKDKEGVKTTQSGLQYKVLTEGSGGKAKEGNTVKVHYKGTLVDGTEFDSSYKRNEPIEFPVQKGALIDGWIEGLQLMNKGSKFAFYIPPELAYGERPRPSIPANSALVFEVELLDISEGGKGGKGLPKKGH